MTQEEKELLLKDLCTRLPYGVRIKIGEYSDYVLIGINPTEIKPIRVELIENEITYEIDLSVENIKPYLRPMSSMTEEEEEEWQKLIEDPLFEAITVPQTKNSDRSLRAKSNYQSNDWLNSHHFDYRGLITIGLAIEAPEDMYNSEFFLYCRHQS